MAQQGAGRRSPRRSTTATGALARKSHLRRTGPELRVLRQKHAAADMLHSRTNTAETPSETWRIECRKMQGEEKPGDRQDRFPSHEGFIVQNGNFKKPWGIRAGRDSVAAVFHPRFSVRLHSTASYTGGKLFLIGPLAQPTAAPPSNAVRYLWRSGPAIWHSSLCVFSGSDYRTHADICWRLPSAQSACLLFGQGQLRASHFEADRRSGRRVRHRLWRRSWSECS